MAVIRARGSGKQFSLPAHCLVGISRAVCDLALAAPDISKEHAELFWTGTLWQIRDLGSRNGTFVNSKRLDAGGRAVLSRGCQIRFGSQSPEWELVDAAAPQLMALNSLSGESRLGDDERLVLPDPQHAEVYVCRRATGEWLAERDGGIEIVEDRGTISLNDGSRWRIYLPMSCPETSGGNHAAPLVANLRLRLSHARHEEHVEALGFCGERRLDLEAKTHHYLLLLLARQRLDDQKAGIADGEQGWIQQDVLLRKMKIKENNLRSSIYRARTQLSGLGILDAAALIERRPNMSQLRLGVRDLEIVVLDPPSRP